ncbi:MAG: alpha/beta fold hydrolase [Planctomycetota bacterium]|nr:alpha/beta fold hydrolase [Planctomycetota bacterium]MDA1137856.1 alpha/beta fold hydrolase [Planctomycetota bacterium]
MPDRHETLRRMQLVMGDYPDSSRRVPLDMRVEDEFEEDGRIRRLVAFTPEPGDRAFGWLLIPKDRIGSTAGGPAMLCLHQTTGIGKDEPAGLGGLPNLKYAAELTARGHVTFSPDYPNFGQYRVDCYEMGYASASMKGIWNHGRAVDLLTGLPEVDAGRIGVIGHSLGGHNALFAAAFDERLKVAVSSCGFTGFAWNDNEGRGTYGDLTDWSHSGYMPRIKEIYHCRADEMPWDFPDVLAAIVPRAVFVNGTKRDFMRYEGVVHCVNVTRPLYEQAGFPERFDSMHPDCQHDFPPDVRELAYAFVDRILG